MYRTLYFGNHRCSKLAKLHRAKERQPPSLSNQARFAPFTLKVAWSGISLIGQLADHNWAIIIAGRLSYGRSILNIFDNMMATAVARIPVTHGHGILMSMGSWFISNGGL